MNIKHLLVTVAYLLVIFTVFGAIAFGLNFHTAPLIEENNKGAEFAPLLAVLPGAKDFERIYDAADAGASTLVGIPTSVLAIYKETSGLGFVFRVSATTQYTGASPMEASVGIDAEGRICGIQIDTYTESIDFRDKDPNYLGAFLGKDSALPDIGTVSGATYSSTAFKESISAGFSALIANNLVAEGVKSDAQILTEMIPTLAPGFSKTVEMTVSGKMEKALRAENGAGFAYVLKDGDASYLAIVNAMGAAKLYNVAGEDVTAENAALVGEALAHATANQEDFSTALKTKLEREYPNATDITPCVLTTYNTVVAAYSFTVDGATCYAFYSRSVGFHQMDVYLFLDASGAIMKMDAKQFIFDEEYFMAFGGMDPAGYKQGFVGITGDTWNGDAAIIATATMTSNAVKQSTTDVFDAFKTIQNGGA